MPPVTNGQFRSWLKGSNNMKMSSDASVVRVTYEGITNYLSLLDFDRDSIESLSKACSRPIAAIAEDLPSLIAAEPQVPAANISTISIRRLVIAVQAAKYYTNIGRTPDDSNMHYLNVLSGFKVDYEAYALLKKNDKPDTPMVHDKDKDKKIIKWVPLFEDALSRTFGSKGPLSYVIRETVDVPPEADDPLQADKHHSEVNGSMMEELNQRLPHTGSIFKDDNKTVFMMIAKAVAGTSVESTIKSFSRTKNGRKAFEALIANHAGDTKYRSIVKARNNLLQNIKWNGRNYPLEQHVSNHRTAIDDLAECAIHIKNAVPNMAQRVEYLLESINSQDSSLQAALGNVRADTNNMRSNFELSAAHLIEVDPYRRSSKSNPKMAEPKISAVSFAGRGQSGVDLRWHTRQEFRALSSDKKDELTAWQRSNDGKAAIKKSRDSVDGNRNNRKRNGGEGGNKSDSETWKKKFKKAIKTQSGLSHVMSVMLAEESDASPIIAAMLPQLPPTPITPAPPRPVGTTSVGALAAAFPALSTKMKLNSILKNGKE